MKFSCKSIKKRAQSAHISVIFCIFASTLRTKQIMGSLFDVEVYNFITNERHTFKGPSRKGLEIKINQMFKEMLEREEDLR